MLYPLTLDDFALSRLYSVIIIQQIDSQLIKKNVVSHDFAIGFFLLLLKPGAIYLFEQHYKRTVKDSSEPCLLLLSARSGIYLYIKGVQQAF